MLYTTNYGLKKPEGNDNFDIWNENWNMDTLDSIIKSISNAAAAAQNTANAAIPDTQKGAANGVATLDGSSMLPVAQLPSSYFNQALRTTDSPTFGGLSTTGLINLPNIGGAVIKSGSGTNSYFDKYLNLVLPSSMGTWNISNTDSNGTAHVAFQISGYNSGAPNKVTTLNNMLDDGSGNMSANSIGPSADTKQITFGNTSLSGYIIASGTNAGGSDDGSVMITSRYNAAQSSDANIKFRSYDGTTITSLATITRTGTFTTLKNTIDDGVTGAATFADTVTVKGTRLVNKYIGTPGGDYRQTVILLHPAYDGTNTLNSNNFCTGKFMAMRGGSGTGLRRAVAEVRTASAYQSNVGTVDSDSEQFTLVTVTYNSVKYMALKLPYAASYWASGIWFDGWISSVGPETLLLVDYYKQDTSTVLNAEINGSIANYAGSIAKWVDTFSMSVLGILKVIPSNTSGVQRGLVLQDNGAGNAEGLSIQWDNSDRTGMAAIQGISEAAGGSLQLQTTSTTGGALTTRLKVANTGAVTTTSNTLDDGSGNAAINGILTLTNAVVATPGSNTGAARIGRYDRKSGSMVVQLGGSGSGTVPTFELLDYDWTKSIFKVANDSSWTLGGIGNRFGKYVGKFTTTGNTNNQKADLYYTGTFYGYFDVTVTGSWSNLNNTGVVKKRFAVAHQSSTTINSQSTHYTDAVGGIASTIAISDITWDATNNRWRIQIVFRGSSSNSEEFHVYIDGMTIDGAKTSSITGANIGLVYTTDATVFSAANVLFKGYDVGISATASTLALRDASGNLVTGSALYFSNDDGILYDDTTNTFSVKLDGTSYNMWHAGNFTPSNYAALSGATFIGQVNMGKPVQFNQAGGSWFWIDNPAANELRISTGGTVGNGPIAHFYDNGNVGITGDLYIGTQGSTNAWSKSIWLQAKNPSGVDTNASIEADPSGVLYLNHNGTNKKVVTGNNTLDNGSGIATFANTVEIVRSGESRFHIYNNGQVAEWKFGQKSSTDHDLKFSKTVAGADTDYLVLNAAGGVSITGGLTVDGVPIIGGIKSVQRGTTGASGTITVNAVNTNKAFLTMLSDWSYASNDSRYYIQLTNSTTITVTVSAGSPVISWELVEFY